MANHKMCNGFTEYSSRRQLIGPVTERPGFAHVGDGVGQMAIDFTEVFFLAASKYLLCAREGKDEQNRKIKHRYRRDSQHGKFRKPKSLPENGIDKQEAGDKEQQASAEKRQRTYRRCEIYIRVHFGFSPSSLPIASKGFATQGQRAKKETSVLAVAHLVNDRLHVAQIVFKRSPTGDS